MKQTFLKSAIAIALSAGIAGCGGGGAATGVTGHVILDYVSGATVTLEDKSGSTVATASTSTDGKYTFDTTVSAGTYKLHSTGGTYVSEANTSKGSIPAADLCAYVSITGGGAPTFNLSSLTTFACHYAEGSSGDKAEKAKEGYKKLKELFGFDESVDLASLLPSYDPTLFKAGDPKATFALVLGMFETLAERWGITPSKLYAALAKDFSDGTFDGKEGNTTISGIKTTILSDLVSSLDVYLHATGTKLSDENATEAAKDSNATEEIRGGVSGGASAGSGLNVGSSGAVTTLSADGKQYVLVAARSKLLVGFDITDPQHPTDINYTTLNTHITDEGLSSLGGVIAIPGKADPMVALYSYSSQKVLFANLKTQAIVSTVDVNVSSMTSFSGGSAYISSGIPDVKHNGIWLATTAGYWFVNTDTYTADATPVSQALGQYIAENIGADMSRNILFSPNYGSGYGGGLQIVKTDTQKAYALSPTTWANQIGYISGMAKADAGSVDSTYGVGVITPEDSETLAFVDLSNMDSNYTFNDTNESNMTFTPKDSETASTLISSFNIAGAGGGSPVISASAIDSETHLMLLFAGYSETIAVAKLQARDANGTWIPIAKRAYYNAGYGGEYTEAHDPHAGGVVHSLTDDKSYGYLLSGDPYPDAVIQVDMQRFLDANVTDPTGAATDAWKLAQSPFDDNTTARRLLIP